MDLGVREIKRPHTYAILGPLAVCGKGVGPDRREVHEDEGGGVGMSKQPR